MPKDFLKRYSPSPEQIRNNSALSFLGNSLHNPNLWYFNRSTISRAFAVGLFFTWVPMPFQTVMSGACAILFRANLPLAVMLVFVTNPVTIPPLFYFAYKLGSFLLAQPPMAFPEVWTSDWLMGVLGQVWQPLFLGSFILALFSSMLGFLTIQVLWRIKAIKRWRRMRARRHSDR